MKFSIIIILISSCPIARSAYPDDVQGTLEPSHQLYCQCSIHHNLSPRSVDPSIFSSTPEIPIEDGGMCVLSFSSPDHLCSRMVDILHAYERDLYSLPLSIYEHSLNYRFVLSSPDIFAEYHLSEHGIYTWLPKLYGHSFDLLYENSYDIHSCCKSKKFIETKVPAINCRVLTIS